MTHTAPARRAIHAALLSVAFAAGCTATPPPAPPPVSRAPSALPSAAPAAAQDEDDIPPVLRGLDPTPAQVEETWRIKEDLDRAAEPFAGAVAEMMRSAAGAVRKCQGDSPFIESDGARVVRMGEDLRGPVLDGVQRLHHLLTPAQRAKLSQRLMETDDWGKRERRNDARTRALGPALDLSMLQLATMLMKARMLWSSFADRAEPWQAHYHTAIVHFARADFDVHREPIAEAPIFAFGVDFVRTGLRFLVPILEPPQCEALAQLIEDKVDEQPKKAEEHRGARRSR